MSASFIEQGSPEWHAERCGKVTASKIVDMLAKTKSGWGAGRANYRAQLVVERMTGLVATSYQNEVMRWGIETEPQAAFAYSFYRGVDLERIGFVNHPTIAMSGASPDRLVGDDGLVEIKCPITKTHIETLLGQAIPGDYVLQMQWQMACTGRQWCDFVSFDPRMPEDLALFVKRMERDQKQIDDITAQVIEFLAEVDTTVERLRALQRTCASAQAAE